MSKRSILIVVATAILTTVGVLTSWWVFFNAVERKTNAEESALIEATLRGIQARFWGVIVESDGRVPDDPYSALVQSGRLSCYSDLLVDRGAVPVFDYGRLPVRVHTNPVDNSQIVLFTFIARDGTAWLAFMNGELERYTPSAKDQARVNEAIRRSSELMDKAGYPAWLDCGHRSQWAVENWKRLQWSDALGIYKLP